tara:strand:- start:104 stop:1624 length:1521 start_codon:yes stop_codon:yes gene_type:complete
MKKILSILVLSLYSIQGFAGSCPDGSDPVKSISADGTYFEYKCSANSINTQEKKESNTSSSTNSNSSANSSSAKDDGSTRFSGPNSEPIKPNLPFDISSGYEGFEKSLVRQPFSPYMISIVDDIVRAGDKALRFEVRSSDCSADDIWSDCENDRERAELTSSSSSDNMTSGEYWFSWSLYIPEEHQNLSPMSLNYGQFHQLGANVAWMFKEQKNGYKIVRTVNAYGDDSDYDDAILISKEDFVGKWHDILINANWSKKDDGFFKVWVNDKLKYDYKGPTMSGTHIYHKFGVYRSYISAYINFQNLSAIEECLKEKGSSKQELALLSKLKRKDTTHPDSLNLYKKCKEFYNKVNVPHTVAYFDEERRGRTKNEVLAGFSIAQLAEKKARETVGAESSPLFDGKYSFQLKRFNDNEGYLGIGSGTALIQNGKITIEKNNSFLSTGSKDNYDTFSAQIDSNGNIAGMLTIGVLYGQDRSSFVNLEGNIEDQIKGSWDDYFDVVIQFKKK